MNKYVVFLPMLNEEISKEYRPQHLEYLEQMVEEGKIFAKGRFTDGTGGLVIYLAESLEQATSYAKDDPYVMYKARNYEIHEWEMVGDIKLK